MFLPFPFFPNPMNFWALPLPWDPFATNAWRSMVKQPDKKAGEPRPEEAERQQAHEQSTLTQQYHSQEPHAGHQGYVQARWHPAAFQKPSVAALGSLHDQTEGQSQAQGQGQMPNGGQWRSEPQQDQAPVAPVSGVQHPAYPGMPHGARERWPVWW